MRESGPASVSLIVCESVLDEKSGVTSAIRIMDILEIDRLSIAARFSVITYLHSRPLDFEQHVAKVQLLGFRGDKWATVADAPAHPFAYSYTKDPTGPGAFMLVTRFNLDLTTFGDLGHFWIQLSVDGEMVEQTPITLLRKN